MKNSLKKSPEQGIRKQRIEMMMRLAAFVSDVESVSSSESDYIVAGYM